MAEALAFSQDHADYVYTLETLREVTEDFMRQAGRETVAEAVEITQMAVDGAPSSRQVRSLTWTQERQRHPNDMEMADLTPGTRVIFYDERRGNNSNGPVGQAYVILSKPYEITVSENSTVRKFWGIDARRVRDHSSDTTQLDSDEGKTSIGLWMWGIAPDSGGYYSPMTYIERYDAPVKT